MWLAVSLARKYADRYSNVEDLSSVAFVGLVKAMNHYDPEKNPIPEIFARKCIKNEIFMYLRRDKNKIHPISLEQTVSSEDGNIHLFDMIATDSELVFGEVVINENKLEIEKIVSTLGEKERRILELRYGLNGNEEHTQKEVGDVLGFTQSYISKLEKKALKQVKIGFEKV